MIESFDLKDFPVYFGALKKRQESFVLEERRTSKKILLPKGKKIIFTKGNKRPSSELLKLMSSVKADAEKAPIFTEDYTSKIVWTAVKTNMGQKVLSKVDISAAYWSAACASGLISKKTLSLFNETTAHLADPKEAKTYRLKALGILASAPKFTEYEFGKIKGKPYRPEQPLAKHYFKVCYEVSAACMHVYRNFDQVHAFYWDCLFVDPEFVEQAKKELKDLGFDSKNEGTGICTWRPFSLDNVQMIFKGEKKETSYMIPI